MNLSEHEFRIDPKYGSGVIAFRNLDDPAKFLSSEFAGILVDELTRNPKATFDFLNMRRRWPGIPANETKFVGASNPGGPGHHFVRKLWIDRDFKNEQYQPKDFAFVPARVADNKYLDAGYAEQLKQLPEKLRKAYLDGSWDQFAGQYFTEWDRERHIIAPFDLPQGWTRIRCLDYGYQNPSACLWLAVDYDGRIFAYREFYQAGFTYEQLARKIVEMTPKDETIDWTVADTSMFARTLDTGKPGEDIMADNGVPITPANKERIAGWNLMRQYLKNGKLIFFSNCTNSINTIPSLVYDENGVNPEDLAKGQFDHLADACRYGLTSLPNLPTRQVERVVNPYLADKDSPWGADDISLGDIYSYPKKLK